MHERLHRLLLLLAVLAAVGCAIAPGASAAPTCDRVAAPSGSDAGDGSAAQPLRTAQRLVDALAPGETGCLRAGSYDQSVRISHGGRSGQRLTLRSWPGERATLTGRLVITREADFVTVEELWLNGRNAGNLPSPTVNGDDVTFRRNDVTNDHTAICFVLGASDVDSSVTYGRAARTLIEANRIHDCGKLPATNHDHGIYVEGTDDAKIVGNWIYDNADRGIQLYPDAQGTEIVGNVLDGNATNLIFSGDLGVAASRSSVHGNLISGSRLRFNVESWYPDGNPKGSANSLDGNCLHAPARTDSGAAGINTDDGGFSVGGNVTADPRYRDRAAKDFRIPASSSCAASFAGDRDAIPGPSTDGYAPLPTGDERPPTPGAPVPPSAGGPAGAPSLTATTSGAGAGHPGARSGASGPRSAGTARHGSDAARGRQGAAAISLRLAAAAARRHSGARKRLAVTGRLLAARRPTARPILVQALVRGAWRTVARARPSRAGAFSAGVRAPVGVRSLRLRAIAPGVASSNVLLVSLPR